MPGGMGEKHADMVHQTPILSSNTDTKMWLIDFFLSDQIKKSTALPQQ